MNEEILLCRQGWDGIERGFREKESMRKKGGCGRVCVFVARRGVGRNDERKRVEGRGVRKDKMYRNEMENGFGWDLGLNGWI